MACCNCCCEKLDKHCCDGVCQDNPCGGCTVDGDCEYWLISPVKNDNPACTEQFFNYYFATFDDAFQYGNPIAGACGPFSIIASDGKCCDNEFYPAQGDLQFGTDADTLTCP
jgi:hypothetical protein